jgi:hypothetical protein
MDGHKLNNQTNINDTTVAPTENLRKRRLATVGITIGALVILAVLVIAIIYLLNNATITSAIRDIMIISLALELLVIGLTVILLIIQVARLVNLFQNEIKPLLESANETMSTLRGTATFLSDAFVEPVIKVNSYFSAFKRLLDLINLNL